MDHFLAHMYETFLENRQPLTLLSPTTFLTPTSMNLDTIALPNYTTNILENPPRYCFDLNINKEDDAYSEGTIGSTIVETPTSQELTFDEARIFQHDYPLQFFGKNTDVRLKKLFKTDEDASPDFVKDMGNGDWLVVEVTTTQITTEKILKKKLLDKWIKYAAILEEITFQDVKVNNFIFHVLVISMDSILSTSPLNSDLASELCLRYRLASQIQREWGFLREDEEFTEEAASVKRAIESVNHDVIWSDGVDVQTLAETLQKQSRLMSERSKYEFPNNPREDLKSVVNIPFMETKAYGKSRDEFVTQFLTSSTPDNQDELTKDLLSMWLDAFSSYIDHPERFSELPFPMQCGLDEKQKIERRALNHRIEIDDSAYSRMLALDGVKAKTFCKRDPKLRDECREKRQRNQIPYSFYCNTDDIETFIKQERHSCDMVKDTMINEISLLRKANQISGLHEYAFEKIPQDLLWSSLIISKIAQELTFCKQKRVIKSQYILKFFSDLPIVLLVRPTKAESHVFFSILIWTDYLLKYHDVSPKAYLIKQKFLCVPFKSAKFSTLENWVTMPYRLLAATEALVLAELSQQEINESLSSLALMCVNNKPEVEEVLTNSRYVYMEAMSSLKNPFKIMSKVPQQPKSRLTVYFAKKLMNLCQYIQDTRTGYHSDLQIIEEEEEIEVHLSDQGESYRPRMKVESKMTPLPSLIYEGSCRNFEQILINSYAGYIVSKSQDSESNQDLKLFTKLYEEEDKLRKNRISAISDGSYTGKAHEWSSSLLNNVLSHAERRLERKLGPSWREYIYSSWLNRLAKTSLPSLATLKSTNVITREEVDKPRKKLIQRMTERFDKLGKDMGDAIMYGIASVKQIGFLIEIFKKEQHGGLREISIMNMESRLLQYSIEVLSRVICDLYPEEAMTHPSSKYRAVQTHLQRLRTMKPKYSFHYTRYDSCDAKRWNQGQSVPKFAKMLCFMTPQRVHGFVNFVCSLWTHKEIKLPKNLINIFDEETQFSNPTYNQMVKEWREGNDDKPLSKNRPFMIIKSGMLQGLLHFTSSLYHVITLDYWRSIVETKFQRSSSISNPFQVVVSFIVSSDDSGVMMTICCNKALTGKQTYPLFKRLTVTRLTLTERLGMQCSWEKSTFLSPSVFEFNSIWTVMGNQVRAILKFCLACISLSDSGTLLGRQEQWATLRQQCLENGLPIKQCGNICQIQGLFNYLMLGSQCSNMFCHFLSHQLQLPNPFAGFFLTDPEFLSGIVTTNFNLYLLAKHTDSGGIMSAAIETSEKLRETSLTASGNMAISSHVSFVRSKTYNRILNEMRPRAEIMEAIDKNPEMLYRKAETAEEVELALWSNFLKNTVVYSLARDRQYIIRVFSSSVYMLSSQCMLMGTAWVEHLVNNDNTKKISLLEFLENTTKHSGPLSERAKTVFFPDHHKYEKLLALNEELKTKNLVSYKKSIRKNYAEVRVYSAEEKFSQSLVETCAQIWKIKDKRVSNFVLKREWARWKALYPFLEDNIEDTFLKGDFKNHIQMRDALGREGEKDKLLHTTSCNAFKSSASLRTFLRYNYAANKKLSKLHDSPNCSDELAHIVSMCNLMQVPGFQAESILRSWVKSKPKDYPFPVPFLPVISYFNNVLIDDFFKSVDMMELVVGYYRIRSSWNPSERKYKGNSIWVGLIRGFGIEVHLDGSDMVKINFEGTARDWIRCRTQFATVTKEHKWNFRRHKRFSQLELTPSFIVRSSIPGERSTCPFYLSESKYFDPKLTYTGLSLNIGDQNQIRIMATTEESENPKTIYSWSVRGNIGIFTGDLSIQNPIFEKAFRNNSLSEEECISLILNMAAHHGEDSRVIGELKRMATSRWIKSEDRDWTSITTSIQPVSDLVADLQDQLETLEQAFAEAECGDLDDWAFDDEDDENPYGVSLEEVNPQLNEERTQQFIKKFPEAENICGVFFSEQDFNDLNKILMTETALIELVGDKKFYLNLNWFNNAKSFSKAIRKGYVREGQEDLKEALRILGKNVEVKPRARSRIGINATFFS